MEWTMRMINNQIIIESETGILLFDKHGFRYEVKEG